MRHLIVRRRSDFDISLVATSDENRALESPYRITSTELTEAQASQLRLEAANESVVLAVPFTLIEPVEDRAQGLVDRVTTNPPIPSWGIAAVGAPRSRYKGDGVRVAILDTGINDKHPAFVGLNLEMCDFTIDENGQEGVAPDYDGHGTHVAGTILGRPVNGVPIGIAPGVQAALIGKVLGPLGCSLDVLSNAIEWALRKKADVICMSFRMNFPGLVKNLIQQWHYPEDIAASRGLEAYRLNVRLFDRIAELVDARIRQGRGAILVAASGNESRRKDDPRFTVGLAPPAAADGFVSVGAIEQAADEEYSFQVASFSNTGCTVVAPGVSILSADFKGDVISKSGTSMAAPHVAGVLALWVQRRFPDGTRPPGWATDIRRDLEMSVTPIPRGTREDVGLGLVQAPLEQNEEKNSSVDK
jgi:subtilisin family serine protease